MRRFRLVACAVLLASLPAIAWSGTDEDSCRNTRLPAEERFAACAAFVDAADEDNERARALTYFAQAYRHAEDYETALATADQALELRPDYPFALGEKGVTLVELNRFGEALAVMDRLVVVGPDDPWNHYYRGVVLRRMERVDEAKAAQEAALALDPDYYWSLRERARLYHYTGPMIEAAETYAHAARLRPLDAGTAQSAGYTYDAAGEPERAAYYYRISLSLAPNALAVRQWLDAYVGDQGIPLLEDLPWRAPEFDRKIRYLRTHSKVDTRDEMEIAIGELSSWFGGEPRPEPYGSSLFEAWIAGADGDTLDWRRHTTDTAGAEIPASPPNGMFRGIFANRFLPLGDKAPPVVAVFGETSPADVWPLQVGKAASGEADYRAVCPEPRTVPSQVFGCLEGIDSPKLGSLSWNLSVERTERVHVPLGFVDCFVLHYTQEGQFKLLIGPARPVNQDLWIWYSPELDTFVRREVLFDGDIILDQAVALVGD